MISVQMSSGTMAEFSYQHDSGLIMLHSADISSQWKPNDVGVEIQNHGSLIKVGFHCTKAVPNYQSFHFKPVEFYKLCKFFKALGYPLHGVNI